MAGHVSGALCSGDPSAVCRREAPKPNQTGSAKVWTTYAYDALNRLTWKSYDDGTPRACFYHDESVATIKSGTYTWTSPSLANTLGRLSHSMTTAAADCSTDNSAITGTAYSYEATGAVATHWQCTPFNCGKTTTWQASYGYNLAGDLTSWTHPANFTITHAVNSAQRVTQVTSTLNDATHPPTLATITYHPFGAVKTLVNGAVTGGILRQEA